MTKVPSYSAGVLVTWLFPFTVQSILVLWSLICQLLASIPQQMESCLERLSPHLCVVQNFVCFFFCRDFSWGCLDLGRMVILTVLMLLIHEHGRALYPLVFSVVKVFYLLGLLIPRYFNF